MRSLDKNWIPKILTLNLNMKILGTLVPSYLNPKPYTLIIPKKRILLAFCIINIFIRPVYTY